MAELADALDSKSSGPQGPCGFDSLLRHVLYSLLFNYFGLLLFPIFSGLRKTLFSLFWHGFGTGVAGGVGYGLSEFELTSPGF